MSAPSVSRVLVLGDIHGQHRALEGILEHFRGHSFDRILSVGDIVDGPDADPDRCIELLRKAGATTVRGNHERWFLRGELRSLPNATLDVNAASRIFLEALPPTVEFETPRGRMMLCHGIGDDDMVVLTADTRGYGLQAPLAPIKHRAELRFVVCGHTHEPMVRTIGHLTFLNAGTLHPDWRPGVMTIDFGAGLVCHHEVDSAGQVGSAREERLS